MKGVWVKSKDPITGREFQVLACSRGKDAELTFQDKKIIAEFISQIVLDRSRAKNEA